MAQSGGSLIGNHLQMSQLTQLTLIGTIPAIQYSECMSLLSGQFISHFSKQLCPMTHMQRVKLETFGVHLVNLNQALLIVYLLLAWLIGVVLVAESAMATTRRHRIGQVGVVHAAEDIKAEDIKVEDIKVEDIKVEVEGVTTAQAGTGRDERRRRISA